MFLRIRNQSGQGLTEYIILLLLVSIISIAAVQSLGKTVRGKIKEVRNEIQREVSKSSMTGGGDILGD